MTTLYIRTRTKFLLTVPGLPSDANKLISGPPSTEWYGSTMYLDLYTTKHHNLQLEITSVIQIIFVVKNLMQFLQISLQLQKNSNNIFFLQP